MTYVKVVEKLLPQLIMIQIGMERNKKNLSRNVTSAKEVGKLTPMDFKNLPLMNILGVEPETLMMALRSKKDWNDPDPFNLNSPEECARISHAWSNEYLILNNLL